MAKVVILTCSRCGHEWARRGGKDPKVCPNCKNTRWNWPADLDLRTKDKKKKSTSQ